MIRSTQNGLNMENKIKSNVQTLRFEITSIINRDDYYITTLL